VFEFTFLFLIEGLLFLPYSFPQNLDFPGSTPPRIDFLVQNALPSLPIVLFFLCALQLIFDRRFTSHSQADDRGLDSLHARFFYIEISS
jgi:hypothetical protein